MCQFMKTFNKIFKARNSTERMLKRFDLYDWGVGFFLSSRSFASSTLKLYPMIIAEC